MTDPFGRRTLALAALLVVAACAGAPRDWAADPPPRPSLRVAAASISADLESWCRSAGGTLACTFVTPPVNHQFPRVEGLPRAVVTLDTGLAARAVTVRLSRVSSSRPLRTVHPQGLDNRRWRFRLPSDELLARIAIGYRDGGRSRSVVVLSPRGMGRERCGSAPCPAT